MAFDMASASPPSASAAGIKARPRHRRRWGAGVAASVLLHVAPLIVAGGYWASRPPVILPPETVFEVDLVRLQAPPRPPSEQPPGPTQVEAVAQQPLPKLPIQPRLLVVAVTDVEPLPAPPPTPRLETPSETPPAPETTAPPSRPAPPAASAAAATQTWQGRLLAHLERRKRYPAEARARRLQGVTHVRFTMDRQGRVLAAAVERGSGHVALDREALALLQRAQPLPAPPAETPGERITLTVPVEFFTRR